ncbi:MAG: chemotaxis protein CheA [Caulobacteraceae bacterium]|nr:chemotaxis protein CheA [Caulobacteraceae bacterium]
MDPMEAIKATFFQECDELLVDLEGGLLAMQGGDTDSETVNAVFRAVHSVKGGAGAFGMDALVRFAHVFETTLDAVRNGELLADAAVVSVLLKSADRLTDHITAAKQGSELDGDDADLVAELQAFTGTAVEEDIEDPGVGFVPQAISLGDFAPSPQLPQVPKPESSCRWIVSFRPYSQLYRNGNDPLTLLRELERLGPIEHSLDADVPSLDDFDPHGAYLTWTVQLDADVSEATVREVFEFVEGQCDLTISRATGDSASDGGLSLSGLLAPARANEGQADDGAAPAELSLEALLALAHGEPAAAMPLGAPPMQAGIAPTAQSATAPSPARPTDTAPAQARAPADRVDTPAQPTIRVDLDRVDRLIDLVGELVINQAMLAQQMHEAGLARTDALALSLDDLEHLTRDIQDSVMAIRAQPVKSVFQRMPRLVREVSAMTGKSARLVTEGEGTEVDKTVIERLTDPLTHMIRNAIDHGLESPEERLAAGKPAEGVISLSAQHRSGRIVIEVSDDGRGINRSRVRQIAVERGIIDPDASLTDEEIDNLIFAPGFSTASEISDISGRGVGMDVVKRSIQALGGRITINSTPGIGSRFTMSLPLTLAVLDGMVVMAGHQTLVVPISVIVETLQLRTAETRALGPTGTVLLVRGSHVPVIDIASELGLGPSCDAGVIILVESELGGLAALRVDAIQGQRQVVIKSLETNYGQVPGVGAATILGDGRVALILDVDAVIALRRANATHSIPLALAS